MITNDPKLGNTDPRIQVSRPHCRREGEGGRQACSLSHDAHSPPCCMPEASLPALREFAPWPSNAAPAHASILPAALQAATARVPAAAPPLGGGMPCRPWG